jgi:hypothetical protein
MTSTSVYHSYALAVREDYVLENSTDGKTPLREVQTFWKKWSGENKRQMKRDT